MPVSDILQRIHAFETIRTKSGHLKIKLNLVPATPDDFEFGDILIIRGYSRLLALLPRSEPQPWLTITSVVGRHGEILETDSVVVRSVETKLKQHMVSRLRYDVLDAKDRLRGHFMTANQLYKQEKNKLSS